MIYCVIKQFTFTLDNVLSLVRFRIGTKVGHGCLDIKDMK